MVGIDSKQANIAAQGNTRHNSSEPYSGTHSKTYIDRHRLIKAILRPREKLYSGKSPIQARTQKTYMIGIGSKQANIAALGDSVQSTHSAK